MTSALTVLAGLVTIIVILLRRYISVEEKKEREKSAYHKELATNDLKPLSARLSDKFDKLRRKIRRNPR